VAYSPVSRPNSALFPTFGAPASSQRSAPGPGAGSPGAVGPAAVGPGGSARTPAALVAPGSVLRRIH